MPPIGWPDEERGKLTRHEALVPINRQIRALCALLVTLALLGSCASEGEQPSDAAPQETERQPTEPTEMDAMEPDADGPVDGDDLFPERLGEPILIATGGGGGPSWELQAQESVEGTCLLVDDELGQQTEGCGFEVPELRAVGFFDHEGIEGSPQLVAGAVDTDAAAVRLEFEAGESIEVATLTAGTDFPAGSFPTSFFVADVTGRAPLAAVIVVTASGQELERRPA